MAFQLHMTVDMHGIHTHARSMILTVTTEFFLFLTEYVVIVQASGRMQLLALIPKQNLWCQFLNALNHFTEVLVCVNHLKINKKDQRYSRCH